MKTGIEVTAYALRCLAEDCEDHRPLMAARVRELADRMVAAIPDAQNLLDLLRTGEERDILVLNREGQRAAISILEALLTGMRETADRNNRLP